MQPASQLGPFFSECSTYKNHFTQPSEELFDKIWKDETKVNAMKSIWETDDLNPSNLFRRKYERKFSLESFDSGISSASALSSSCCRRNSSYSDLDNVSSSLGIMDWSSASPSSSSCCRRNSAYSDFDNVSSGFATDKEEDTIVDQKSPGLDIKISRFGYGSTGNEPAGDGEGAIARPRTGSTRADIEEFTRKFGYDAAVPRTSLMYRPRKGKYRKEF